jgi:putative membrane protein
VTAVAEPDGGPRPGRDREEEPDYRFTLANEPTFLAWIRTSLALLAAGVAIVQLVPRVGFAAGRYVVGELLIVLSILVAATSVRRWQHVQQVMRAGGALPGTRLPLIVAAGLMMVAVLGFLLVLSPR